MGMNNTGHTILTVAYPVTVFATIGTVVMRLLML